MLKRLHDHLSYANVVSTLCLFALLGGIGYAAAKIPKDSVGSRQIKDGSVKGVDVRDDGLTGADIAEGSLGKVDSASQADSAASAQSADQADAAGSVDGVGFASIDAEFPLNQPPTTVLDLGGLQLKATCTIIDGVTVRADTTVNDALLHASVLENNNSAKVTEDSDFDSSDDPALNIQEGDDVRLLQGRQRQQPPGRHGEPGLRGCSRDLPDLRQRDGLAALSRGRRLRLRRPHR